VACSALPGVWEGVESGDGPVSDGARLSVEFGGDVGPGEVIDGVPEEEGAGEGAEGGFGASDAGDGGCDAEDGVGVSITGDGSGGGAVELWDADDGCEDAFPSGAIFACGEVLVCGDGAGVAESGEAGGDAPVGASVMCIDGGGIDGVDVLEELSGWFHGGRFRPLGRGFAASSC